MPGITCRVRARQRRARASSSLEPEGSSCAIACLFRSSWSALLAR
jgi:hypothetical protein